MILPHEHDKPAIGKLVGDNLVQEEVKNREFIVMCYAAVCYVDALY
jgi:hypothetical protein